MFSLGGDDDDQDFLVAGGGPGGSKLASLFGGVDSGGGNESLTYTAPKQPKKRADSNAHAASSGTTVMKACAVHAFKYVNGSYANQGKVGAAIIGNHAERDYKILLYYSKQQQLTNAKVFNSFHYTLQPNNYASFYDEARINWSIAFDTKENCIEFAKQVALAKALSDSVNHLITQDLEPGEGGPLEVDDSAEVKYTGWLLTHNAFGEIFDTNLNAEKLFRFKLGRGKVIKGWDEGVQGMKKSGKRLLVVPSNMAYGSKGSGSRIPPDSNLIFEIDVIRVKLAKGRDSPQPAAESTPPAHQPPPPPPESAPEDVKSRSRSISDQLQHSPKSDKAKILSRMAKMGQAMIAPPGTQKVEQSDDDAESQASQETPASPKIVHAKPQIAPRPTVQPSFIPTTAHVIEQPMVQPQMNFVGQPMAAQSSAASQLALYQSQPQYQQAFLGQVPQYQNVFPGQPLQTAAPQAPSQPAAAPAAPAAAPPADLPILLSESRQHNTEVRLAVSKLTDKMERVFEKLETIQTHTTQQMAMQSSYPSMETGMLLTNLQRVIHENDRLKKELYDKSQKIENLNDKISDLHSKNQSAVGKIHSIMEEQNESMSSSAVHSQSKVLQVEKEKVKLAEDLSMATSQISDLQLELTDLKRKNTEYRQKLSTALSGQEDNSEEATKLKVQLAEALKKAEDASYLLKDERNTRKAMENKLSGLNEEIEELKTQKEGFEKSISERRKKAAAEKQRFEEEIEDLKSQHEEELKEIRSKFKKHKASADTTVSDKISQIEDELNSSWQTKLDRQINALNEKHTREMLEIQEEKQQMEIKLKEILGKLHGTKSQRTDLDKELTTLKDENEELKVWKEKYDQSLVMETKYKERIKQLLEYLSTANEKNEDLVTEIKRERVQRERLHEQVVKLKEAPPAPAPVVATGGGLDQEAVSTEVKKVMNSVFQQVRSKFDVNEKYSGRHVVQEMLETIKETTLKMMKKDAASEEESSEDEEESENESADEETEAVKPAAIPVAATAVVQQEVKPKAVEIVKKVEHNAPVEVQVESVLKSPEPTDVPVEDNVEDEASSDSDAEEKEEIAETEAVIKNEDSNINESEKAVNSNEIKVEENKDLNVEEPKPEIGDTKPEIEETKPQIEETIPEIDETKEEIEETKPEITVRKPENEDVRTNSVESESENGWESADDGRDAKSIDSDIGLKPEPPPFEDGSETSGPEDYALEAETSTPVHNNDNYSLKERGSSIPTIAIDPLMDVPPPAQPPPDPFEQNKNETIVDDPIKSGNEQIKNGNDSPLDNAADPFGAGNTVEKNEIKGDVKKTDLEKEDEEKKRKAKGKLLAADMPPLFGGESDFEEEDFFSTPVTKAVKKAPTKSSTTKKSVLLDDDDSKPTPPPLFGGDDDDDDIDWFK